MRPRARESSRVLATPRKFVLPSGVLGTLGVLSMMFVGCQKSPAVAPENPDTSAPDPRDAERNSPTSPKSPSANPVLDLSRVPVASELDQPYKNVFSLLDGEWQGTFRIYVNPEGQADGPAQPTRIRPALFKRPPFKLQSTLTVRQSYVSETPFFQRVRIVDRLSDGTVIESEGVNKVEDGKMWCIVKKPDDLVVHAGERRGRSTIIWSRQRLKPLAIERFEEQVTRDRYTIVGWGYYGNDDPKKAPRMFFEAEYTRPTE